MAIILDGARVAKEIKQQIRKEVADMHAAYYLARPPHLVTILVGNNPASQIYVRNKARDCEECGFTNETVELPEDTTRGKLLNLIVSLNKNQGVDGILCQLPLPEGLDEWAILNAIDPGKDVDCFHPENVGRLTAGRPAFKPCTPAGVMRLLAEYSIPIAGKNCVVIGRSNIVGKPMAQLLTAADGTVTICHSRTENLAAFTRNADILVSAVGRPGLVTADMVKDGAVVVDVAMNRGLDGKLCGDVDFDTVQEKASYITPVPGGVGPMTRAMLMENLFKAAMR
jgi:methylenetetrahydrofolate dehydrogenase (NADP+)/methenyltetrahydrofolate cyclohydrolase